MQVLVARIGKPHGIRGEVTVELFTDAPEERFSRGEVLHIDGFTHGTVAATVAPAGALTVASARWNKKILVVRFEEITTRNHAEDLRNTLLMFEVPEDVNSEEEGFYEHQLLELPVFLLEDVPDGEIPNDNPAVGEPLGTRCRCRICYWLSCPRLMAVRRLWSRSLMRLCPRWCQLKGTSRVLCC